MDRVSALVCFFFLACFLRLGLVIPRVSVLCRNWMRVAMTGILLVRKSAGSSPVVVIRDHVAEWLRRQSKALFCCTLSSRVWYTRCPALEGPSCLAPALLATV